MTFYRRPRVFLSYRHEERRPGLFGDGYNRKHRDWIETFAHALAAWNIDVIWDARLRDLFRPHTSVDPERLEFLAEVSTLCLQSAQAFLPVLTAGYAERIAGGEKGFGTVSEEWARAVAEQKEGRLEIAPIVREWPIPGYAAPPTEMVAHKAWDFRFVAPSKDEVEMLGDSLHMAWDVERPSLDMSFADLISAYLKFCVSEYKLPWPGLERWGCDFNRTRIYLEFMHNMAQLRGSKTAGAERDWAEAGFSPPSAETRDAEFEKQRTLLHNIADKVSGSRKGFDFASKAPGGRASNGLYFGPTIEAFSYLWKPGV